MTCMPSFPPSSAKASPTRRFRSSDSTTHGPAMRNGDSDPPKCCAMSVGTGGEPGGGGPCGLGDRSVSTGPGATLLASRAHEAGEQGVRARGAGLELGVELAADEPGVIGKLDHLDERPVGRKAG